MITGSDPSHPGIKVHLGSSHGSHYASSQRLRLVGKLSFMLGILELLPHVVQKEAG